MFLLSLFTIKFVGMSKANHKLISSLVYTSKAVFCGLPISNLEKRSLVSIIVLFCVHDDHENTEVFRLLGFEGYLAKSLKMISS